MRPATTRRGFLQNALGGLLIAGAEPAFGSVSEDEILHCARRLTGRTGAARIKGLIPKGSESNLAPIIAEWMRLSKIPVDIEIVDYDQINGRMSLDALARRASYDFALPATFGMQDLAWSHVIRPLTGIESALCIPPPAPSLYELGDWIDGDRYGLQTDGDVYLMFYRDDLLHDPAEAGRYADRYGRLLDVPVSWEELDRQLAFFHRPDDGLFGGVLFRNPDFAVWEFWSRMHGKGILPFSPDLTPMIDTDGAIAALEDLVRASDFLHPRARTSGLFGNWRIFQSGTTYCNIGWGGSQKVFNKPSSPIRGAVRHAALPGGAIPPASQFNWGWSYVVPTRSSQPELAYLFARFAVSSRVSTLAVREADGYFDPFREEHYVDPAIEEVYSRPFLDVHRSAMAGAIPDLYLPGYGSYFDTLSRAIGKSLNREEEPRTALRHASEQWQVIAQNYDKAKLIRRWHEVLAAYPAHLRTMLVRG